MNRIFYIINKVVSILLFIFGLYFLWIAFSFIFLGTIFYGSNFTILMELLFELSLICLWMFSRSFISKSPVIPKISNTANVKNNEQYKDWF